MAEEAAAEEAPANAAPAKGGGGGMMPALLIIVLMPVVSFAMFKFLFIPMIKAEIPEHGAEHEELGPEDVEHLVQDTGERFEYPFPNDVVVNLKGVALTRYLQASITISSANPEIAALGAKSNTRLRDASLKVLSSLTLADLEKPEIRTLTATQLKQQYERILRDSIDEVLFSNWVVQ